MKITYHEEVISLLFFIFLSLLIGILLFGVSYLLTNKHYDAEKLSAYECGFQPFGDARETFNIKYYIVSLLFVLFDLEVLFLFPWSVNLYSLLIQDIINYISMLFFLVLLSLGFFYEFRIGALDWE